MLGVVFRFFAMGSYVLVKTTVGLTVSLLTALRVAILMLVVTLEVPPIG